MTYSLSREFSTYDKDNDQWSLSCADLYKSGWWYKMCSKCDLNGQYLEGQFDSEVGGVEWMPWKGFGYSLKFAEMKLRPHYFT